jgi:hypothetical protein
LKGRLGEMWGFVEAAMEGVGVFRKHSSSGKFDRYCYVSRSREVVREWKAEAGKVVLLPAFTLFHRKPEMGNEGPQRGRPGLWLRLDGGVRELTEKGRKYFPGEVGTILPPFWPVEVVSVTDRLIVLREVCMSRCTEEVGVGYGGPGRPEK